MSRRLWAPVRSNCSCGPTIWRATANSMAPGRTGSCRMSSPQVAVSRSAAGAIRSGTLAARRRKPVAAADWASGASGNACCSPVGAKTAALKPRGCSWGSGCPSSEMLPDHECADQRDRHDQALEDRPASGLGRALLPALVCQGERRGASDDDLDVGALRNLKMHGSTPAKTLWSPGCRTSLRMARPGAAGSAITRTARLPLTCAALRPPG